MAFDGIGGKMIIHKATDVARDAASQQRRADLMQSMIGKQVKNDELRNQTRVQDTQQPSEAVIQREKERKGRDPHSDSGQGRARVAEREELEPDGVPRGGITTDEKGQKRIDIRI